MRKSLITKLTISTSFSVLAVGGPPKTQDSKSLQDPSLIFYFKITILEL